MSLDFKENLKSSVKVVPFHHQTFIKLFFYLLLFNLKEFMPSIWICEITWRSEKGFWEIRMVFCRSESDRSHWSWYSDVIEVWWVQTMSIITPFWSNCIFLAQTYTSHSLFINAMRSWERVLHITTGINFLQVLPTIHAISVSMRCRIRSASRTFQHAIWTIAWVLESHELIRSPPASLTLTSFYHVVHGCNCLPGFIFFNFLHTRSHRFIGRFIRCLYFWWSWTFASSTSFVSFDKEGGLLLYWKRVGLKRRVWLKIQILAAHTYVIWSCALEVYSWSARVSTSFRSLFDNFIGHDSYSILNYWVNVTNNLLWLISLLRHFCFIFDRRNWRTCH